MKKLINKLTMFGLMMFVSIASFAGNLNGQGNEFSIDKDGNMKFTGGSGKTDYSGGFWNSITEFIQQWGNGLTWVLAGVAVLAFIIGLYKYISNPDLTQVIVALITMVIFVLLAIKSRSILATTLAGEITPEMIETGVRTVVENVVIH